MSKANEILYFLVILNLVFALFNILNIFTIVTPDSKFNIDTNNNSPSSIIWSILGTNVLLFIGAAIVSYGITSRITGVSGDRAAVYSFYGSFIVILIVNSASFLFKIVLVIPSYGRAVAAAIVFIFLGICGLVIFNEFKQMVLGGEESHD